MKYGKILGGLLLGIILPLLLVALPAMPAQAAGELILDPERGEIGDWVEIDGYGFTANERIRLYFSSDKAVAGEVVDDTLTAYEYVDTIFTDNDGLFITISDFAVPDELTDGEDTEDVHGGDYYVYATDLSKRIMAIAPFTVTFEGEIALDPAEGTVGSEVEISGEGLRPDQKITVKYDGSAINIVRGAEQTDSAGQFSGTILTIPVSPLGQHTITVKDESGNKLKAEFSVKPKITVDPTSQAIGKTVTVSGTGFGEKEYITITFDGDRVFTTPVSVLVNHDGNFKASFIVPFSIALASGGTGKVGAYQGREGGPNATKVPLTVLPIPVIPASISLSPVTSLTAPGHVGMELTVDGAGFTANTIVTITYSNGEATAVATAPADGRGDFSATFTAPPSIAGSHTITATDGTTTLTAIFIMESAAPPMPVPRLPEVVTTVAARAYFDWEDVADPSGLIYVLQIGADPDFTTIVLEKKGLTASAYTITEEERLASTEEGAAYYWRVKAIDSAFNESEWTTPWSFYVGPGTAIMADWMIYTWIGLGGLLLAVLVFWWLRRIAR